MTTVTTNLSTTGTGRGSAKSLLATLIEGVRIRSIGVKSYEKTRSELSGMSDRDLADIGLSADMIHDIAREAGEMAMTRARAVI